MFKSSEIEGLFHIAKTALMTFMIICVIAIIAVEAYIIYFVLSVSPLVTGEHEREVSTLAKGVDEPICFDHFETGEHMCIRLNTETDDGETDGLKIEDRSSFGENRYDERY